MANEYPIRAADFRVDTSKVIEPIITSSVARKIFPVNTALSTSDKQYRYYPAVDDYNFAYQMEVTNKARDEAGVSSTDVSVPVISSSVFYTYDDLKRINNGVLPIDSRYNMLRRRFLQAEDRIALAGASLAVDNTLVNSMSVTGTTSTAATGTTSVTSYANLVDTLSSAIGQLKDGLGEVVDPIIWVVTSDVYKKLLGVEHTYQTINLYERALQYLRGVNANSQIVVSDFLGATVSVAANKKGYTAGTTNGALCSYNPQYYEIVCSPLEVRTSDANISTQGFEAIFVERWLPLFYEKKAIIYMGTLAVA